MRSLLRSVKKRKKRRVLGEVELGRLGRSRSVSVWLGERSE